MTNLQQQQEFDRIIAYMNKHFPTPGFMFIQIGEVPSTWSMN